MPKVLTEKRRAAIIDMIGLHETNCEAADDEYIKSYQESYDILCDFVGYKKGNRK